MNWEKKEDHQGAVSKDGIASELQGTQADVPRKEITAEPEDPGVQLDKLAGDNTGRAQREATWTVRSVEQKRHLQVEMPGLWLAWGWGVNQKDISCLRGEGKSMQGKSIP